jgi:prevent-host-death family protein
MSIPTAIARPWLPLRRAPLVLSSCKTIMDRRGIIVHFVLDHNGDTVKASKSVPATEFKARCLTLLEEVRATRQPLLVTRHGRPVVEICPYVPKDRQHVNPLKGSILYQGDLLSPIDEKWDSAP